MVLPLSLMHCFSSCCMWLSRGCVLLIRGDFRSFWQPSRVTESHWCAFGRVGVCFLLSILFSTHWWSFSLSSSLLDVIAALCIRWGPMPLCFKVVTLGLQSSVSPNMNNRVRMSADHYPSSCSCCCRWSCSCGAVQVGVCVRPISVAGVRWDKSCCHGNLFVMFQVLTTYLQFSKCSTKILTFQVFQPC